MRNWMRERLQRRKKKDSEPGAQPAPPPLQPAYFEAGESPAEPAAKAVESKPRPGREIAAESEPAHEKPWPQTAPESAPEVPSGDRPSGPAQRGRPRRRRGGRGRSGRGREQAVAQAFSPAAIKGTAPEAPVEDEAHDAGDAIAEDAISGGSVL